MWVPKPISADEQLPRPAPGGLCMRCSCPLYYQRQERPTYPKHFFFCRRCRGRYAAWESGWEPFAARH